MGIVMMRQSFVAYWRERALGTISPSTMCRYVSTATDRTLAAPCATSQEAQPYWASHSWSHLATACSPYMPSPRLANVMPSWAVAM